MRTIHLRSRHMIFTTALAAASGMSACNPCPEDGTHVHGPIPDLGVHGTAALLPNCSGAECTHEGVFSNGVDLAEPVIPATVPVGKISWKANSTSSPHASAPNFGTVLDEAVTDVENNRLLVLDADYVADHLALVPGVESSVYLPPHTFYEYPPQLGRWLDSEWTSPSWSEQQTQHSYPPPSVMDDLRRRDAREYCVARTAMKLQGPSTTTMGSLVGFSFSLFGNPVDVGVVEPTVAIDRPMPFTAAGPGCPIVGGCDGSLDATNAFAIPFLFGTRLTLWKGLGTGVSLPEIRYPVVKLTGGSETPTSAECGIVNGGFDFTKEYTTVTQANAIASSAAEVSLSTTIPLFDVGGLLFVDLELGTSFDIGKPELVEGRPSNDRLLVPPEQGWPEMTRTGDAGAFPGAPDTVYNDGNWALSANPGQSIGTSLTTFTVNASNAPPIASSLHPHEPFMVRALEDSDERASFLAQATLAGSIHGLAGFHWGPFEMGLQASGTLSGYVGIRHSLADAAGAVTTEDATGKKIHPISSLTVTPSAFAGATLGFDVALHLKVPFSVGSPISLDVPLLAAGPYTLASYDSGPWSEEHRLRLGTGSQSDDPENDPMNQPVVDSHFPNTSKEPFPSFPDPVDGCLEDDEPNLPPPSECPPTTPTVGSPASVQLCFYDTYTIGANNPCNPQERAAYLAEQYPQATAAELQCLTDEFVYLCSDVSQQQLLDDQPVVAHVLDLADQGEGDALLTLAESCLGVWAGKPEEFAQTFFKFRICDDAGNLWTPTSAVENVNPGAPPVTPATCL